ncbi:hypothetical protein N665_0251s0058 [Sinapis alba]|nr:hypothetical protein N665_0251s0058 [Sinapis alba]
MVAVAPAEDGYNWRKCSEKRIKRSEYPRHYYECTYQNCKVKKKVDRSREDHITEIIYEGDHNHSKPPPYRRSGGVVVVDASSTFSNEEDEDDRGTHGSASLDYVGGGGGEGDESESIRRKLDAAEMSGEIRVLREPRVVIQTTSDVDILDDGYRWKKTGQKVVKENPRKYYKCKAPGCKVTKHVERASHDLKSVITSYEGKHNHDVPAA